MELITVHVSRDNTVMIYCPFCGITQKASIDRFRNIKHKITTRCKCGNCFEVQLNFRKQYRKEVKISGQFMTISPNMSVWWPMNISDLSRTGVGFEMINIVTINIGNIIRVRFSLDKGQQSLIDKKAIVRFTHDKFLGCEFLDLADEEKELGFYLFS